MQNEKSTELDEKSLFLLARVKTRRAKVVLEHILRYKKISTKEITSIYGYAHPPRAAREIKDFGIALKSTPNKKTGTVYELASFEVSTEFKGRDPTNKKLKKELYEKSPFCANCLLPCSAGELDLDHRIPFAIGGEDGSSDKFNLLCRPCDSLKRSSCMKCPNWSEKNIDTCKSCYWADFSNYSHKATRGTFVTRIEWSETESQILGLWKNREMIQNIIKILINLFLILVFSINFASLDPEQHI